MADNVYITVPDDQAAEICDIVRTKAQTSDKYRSRDLASAILKTLGNFVHCTAEVVKA